MLMEMKALPITAKAEALATHQRKLGGEVRGGKLYQISSYLQAFTCAPPQVLTDPTWREYVFVLDFTKFDLAKLGMRRKGFPFYFPQEPKSVKKNQFQRRVVMRPMLSPEYAFTSFAERDDRWKQIAEIKGCRRVLCYSERPWPVPLDAMKRIRDREASLAIKAKRMPMPVDVGSLVQIEVGPFSGFIGKVIELIEHQARITVDVELFGRQTPVEVSVNQVRPV